MSRIDCDVPVVGGGPGGPTAGARLVERRRDAAAAEPSRHPGADVGEFPLQVGGTRSRQADVEQRHGRVRRVGGAESPRLASRDRAVAIGPLSRSFEDPGDLATSPQATGLARAVLQAGRRLGHCAMFYVILFHLGMMSLTWGCVCLLLNPLLPRATGRVLGRAAISSVYRGFWKTAQWLGLMRIDFGALDALESDAGLIIAANHPTMLDAMLVIARVPRGICIMRSSLMRSPFLGAGARLARYIRNDPPRGMIRSCIENLRAGAQLVIFPEGTRTVQPPVNAFRPGLTLIAQLADVPIQTVLIEADSPYLGKGWPIWKPPAFPVVFRLRLGQRFAPDADHAGLLKRLESYFGTELDR